MRKVAPSLLVVVLVLSGAFLSSLQGVQAQAEPPFVKKIGPDVLTAGCPTFTLRAIGKGFQAGARLLFDGSAVADSRVDKKGKLVLGEVDASRVATPGTHTVQVVNADGALSVTKTLTVVTQDPDLSLSLEINSSGEDFPQNGLLLVSGRGFNANSKGVIWGTLSPNTTFLSDTQLIVEFPQNLTAEPARIPIMIRNKSDQFSNAEIFFIVPAPATLSTVDPDSVDVGTDPFDIEVRGSSFKEDAQLVVGGIPLVTTAGKNGRLLATVPGSLRSSPRILSVRVEQDGIQSADLSITVAPEDDPFIFAVSPSRIRVGEKKASLSISGANLGDDVKAFINGEEANITESTRKHLTVRIPKELLDAPGTHTVEIRDSEDRVSNIQTFVVVPDVIVATIAGEERAGFNPGCAAADDVQLRNPRRLSLAPDGLLYFTDQFNHSVRTFNPGNGQVCTIVGSELRRGYVDSNDAPGRDPAFSVPSGVVVDASGTIFVTENGNNVVRRIRLTGGRPTVSTFAGQNELIDNPDRQEKLNSTRDGIAGFRDGTAAEAQFRQPDDIIVAPDGSLYVADANNHAIRHIISSGGNVTVETIAGNSVPGFADGDGANARFNTPTAIALSLDGKSLFVADMSNFRIRRIDLLTRRVETFAGIGSPGSIDGPANEAFFARPIGLAMDGDGTLYVAELDGNAIRRVDTAGNVTTLAGDPTNSKFKDGAGLKATFNGPRGLAIDRARGILYVADYNNFRIRSIALR